MTCRGTFWPGDSQSQYTGAGHWRQTYYYAWSYLLARSDNLALFILDIGAAISVGDIITKHLNVEHINKVHASRRKVFRHFSNYYWRTTVLHQKITHWFNEFTTKMWVILYLVLQLYLYIIIPSPCWTIPDYLYTIAGLSRYYPKLPSRAFPNTFRTPEPGFSWDSPSSRVGLFPRLS